MSTTFAAPDTITDARFFARYEGGEWVVNRTLDPHLDNYGPFVSAATAWDAIQSPYAVDELPLYEPTAAERAEMRRWNEVLVACLTTAGRAR